MNRIPELDLVLRAYLADDGLTAPDRVLDAVEARIAREPRQRKLPIPVRTTVTDQAKFIVGLTAAGIIAALGWSLLPKSAPGPAGPSPTPTTSATSTSVPSAAAEAPECRPSDIKVYEIGTPGGSPDHTTISLILDAPTVCTVDGYPTMVLLDRSGAELARSVPDGSGRVRTKTDYFFHSELVIESWCGADADLPLSLGYLIGDIVMPVTGWSITSSTGLAPCVGARTTLAAAKWVLTP